MTNGLLGRKLAMTQIFDKDGNFIPVTLVETGPCTVLEVNEEAKKVTLGFEDAKESRVGKPQLGYFKKIGVAPKRVIKEFTYDEEALNKILENLQKQAEAAQEESPKEEVKEEAPAEAKAEEAKQEESAEASKEAEGSEEAQAEETPAEEAPAEEAKEEVVAPQEPAFGVGSDIKADLFRAGDYVDVSGVSIGKGFQGGMKRWGWSGGPASHGSRHHRAPGSIGQCADPAETWKGTNLPGRMGGKRVTTQGLRVMDVDVEKNLLVIKGAIPGSRNGLVEIRRSFKKEWQDPNKVKEAVKVKVNPMKQSKKGKK